MLQSARVVSDEHIEQFVLSMKPNPEQRAHYEASCVREQLKQELREELKAKL